MPDPQQSPSTGAANAWTEAWPTRPAIHRSFIGGGEGRGFSVRGAPIGARARARVSRFIVRARCGAPRDKTLKFVKSEEAPRKTHLDESSSPTPLPHQTHARQTLIRQGFFSPLQRGSARRPSPLLMLAWLWCLVGRPRPRGPRLVRETVGGTRAPRTAAPAVSSHDR